MIKVKSTTLDFSGAFWNVFPNFLENLNFPVCVAFQKVTSTRTINYDQIPTIQLYKKIPKIHFIQYFPQVSRSL